jgi:hypothetical protein
MEKSAAVKTQRAGFRVFDGRMWTNLLLSILISERYNKTFNVPN